MLLQVPHMLGLLLPLGMFVGMLLVYGRMYVDSEMTVLSACGMSTKKLTAYTMGIASIVLIIVALLNLYLSPKILGGKDRLYEFARSASIVDTIVPGRFQKVSGGKQVYYVEEVSRDRHTVNNVFIAQRAAKDDKPSHDWNVLSARHGYVKEDNHDRYFVLEDGTQYFGIPGERDYRIVKFGSLHTLIEVPRPKVP